jgi:hypothetical protein
MALDEIQKLRITTACSGGVVSLLRSPSGDHTRGRGERVALLCALLLHGALLYIVGRECTLPLPKPPRAPAKGGGGQNLVGARPADPYLPLNSNTSRLGLGLMAHGAPSTLIQ